MIDLTVYSAAELASAIRNGEFSVREAVESHLDRIEAVNSRLNAVVKLRSSTARAEADRADAALSRGEIWGALHGVPMTIKDNRRWRRLCGGIEGKRNLRNASLHANGNGILPATAKVTY
jgi:Asp-tRNA(Asn)/Glu-tRNA(Gln) amidotransferase A subunit family amidase